MKKLITFIVSLLFCTSILSNTPVRVACVGNSVTFGAGIENADEKYPNRLQEMLGEGYHVKNFGHSGATLLKRGHRPYTHLPEYDSAIAFQPDIVIIHLGLNDTDPRNWPHFRDEFVRDYSELIASFRDANPEVEVKICRMTPIFTGHRRFASSTRDWFWQIQSAIETVAEVNQVELIDLHTPLHQRPDLFPDALHPTAEGATIIAKTVHGAITGQFGGLQLAPVFSNRMVLQRNQPIRLWGIANKGTEITIELDGETRSAQADTSGRWEVLFPPMQAGGPYSIKIDNEESHLELTDILIGDVWLSSGQSNMEFKLKHTATANKDIATADYPEIRLLNMQPVDYTDNKAWSQETLDKMNRLEYFNDAEWQHCTPVTAENFSAVAYHFGRDIHTQTGVPIGLILNAVGGSPTEAWIDRLTLEHHPRLVGMFTNWSNNDYINSWCRGRAAKNIENGNNPMQRHPYHPAYLFEAGIQDITPLPIAGIIWYQGESNEQNVELHEVLLPTLVKSWREAWEIDLPFYYVQLSSMAVGRETWGHFRDSQRRLMSAIPNSAMVVSSDLGDSTDVHPREKKQIGERLARVALHHTYGMKEIVPSGPLIRDAVIVDGAVQVRFDFGDLLQTSDGQPLREFELAEYPGLFYPASAKIQDDKVIVQSTEVSRPRYVRYGWSSYTDGNLVNEEKLPASTFCTQVKQLGE